MYNLIRFLQKNYFIFLFLLLEVISIVMLTGSHTYHRAAVSHNINQFTGEIYNINAGITDYFSLRNANNKLRLQNAQLQSRLANLEATIQPTDTVMKNAIFEFLPARVVSNTVNLRNNYIIIDKGSNQGVRKDMGLVAPEGAVGIIIGVSENYATAMSLLHKYATLSVKFNNSNQIAQLNWKGGNYRYGELSDIPTHVLLQQGDTVITSGHSFVFPEGIMVGSVEEFVQSEKGNLNAARVQFAVDFNQLRNVYVVKNFHRNELDQLQKIKTNE